MPFRFVISFKLTLFRRPYFVPCMMQSCIALVWVKYTLHCNTIYISPDYDLYLAGWQIYISPDCDLHHGVLRFNIKSCTARRYSEVRRINVWSPSSLSVLISVVADPTVLWNPWQVPFPQQASRSELIPSQVQLSSQLGLFHVCFPQLEFRAEKTVVTGKARCHNTPWLDK